MARVLSFRTWSSRGRQGLHDGSSAQSSESGCLIWKLIVINNWSSFFSQTREGFTEFQEIAQELKSKYMNFQLKPESEFTIQGYLYLMEKSE